MTKSPARCVRVTTSTLCCYDTKQVQVRDSWSELRLFVVDVVVPKSRRKRVHGGKGVRVAWSTKEEFQNSLHTHMNKSAKKLQLNSLVQFVDCKNACFFSFSSYSRWFPERNTLQQSTADTPSHNVSTSTKLTQHSNFSKSKTAVQVHSNR